MVFSLVLGRVQVTPGVYPLNLTSMQVVFLILTALCTFGVFASCVRGSIREFGASP
ncbi:MAG: hypothetical protein QMD46_08835 [Methanomicrobiales archaeon]|nr:hypothetical protein [Methanomicrobiales archaeon]MDI6875472.1 hypothetical protein [Methanomicrobiales archaeon]